MLKYLWEKFNQTENEQLKQQVEDLKRQLNDAEDMNGRVQVAVTQKELIMNESKTQSLVVPEIIPATPVSTDDKPCHPDKQQEKKEKVRFKDQILSG